MPNAKDISRESANVVLPPEVADEIIQKSVEESAFMRLAERIPIAGPGKEYQTIANDPEPEWVAETGVKPVGKFEFGNKTVKPYKMALIVPFSNEFRRDKKALYDACVGRMPKLFGRKFDRTIMGATPPGENFDVLGGATGVSLVPPADGSVYGQFLAADSVISAADGIMNGVALAPQGKSIVLGALDGVGHPLFTPGVGSNTVGNILGAVTEVCKGVYVPGDAGEQAPAVVGVAGDFDSAAWGAVAQIEGSISDQATIEYDGETIHLWQRNMFAVRFEIELSFMVRDINHFVLLTGLTPGA